MPPQKLSLFFISVGKSLAADGMSASRSPQRCNQDKDVVVAGPLQTRSHTTSDKALSRAAVFSQHAESWSSVLAAPGMPQAAFPLHKAKTVQENASSPMMLSPPSPAPCLRQRTRGPRLSAVKTEGVGKTRPCHLLCPASARTLGTQWTRCTGATGPTFTGAHGAGKG